jgi:MoaA/NifB/PqqE/SkfB family radical SAM enzyme
MRTVRENRILHDVALELTYKCNLKCFYCYNDVSKKGTPLTLDDYRVVLSDLADMGTLFIMLTGGEPMIHPHFFEIGKLTKAFGFVTRIRTNGHSMTTKMARRVRDEIQPFKVEVSLHGANAESHDRQTCVPGSFDRLIKNIIESRDEGLSMSVVTTPTSWNEHEIVEMYALCDSLGVPLRFQGPVAPRDNGDLEPLSIQPTQKAWQQIKKIHRERLSKRDDKVYVNKAFDEPRSGRETKSTCGVGVSGVDIDPYGNVQACLHLQESAGNLHEQSIKEIWDRSPLFTRARSRAIESAAQFEDAPVSQLGAPLYCLAVEENLNKRSKVKVSPPTR